MMSGSEPVRDFENAVSVGGEASPLVSVVIPCYNYGQYLREAVESVKQQTLPSVEIIVVDGGSDDALTLGVLTELQQEGVTIYLREERAMVGENRNFGIQRCSGPFVCCLDADDVLFPNCLESMLYRMVSDQFDVVGCGARAFGDRSTLMGVKPVGDPEDILRSNGMMSASLFRKSLWEAVGGFEDFGLGTEYVFEDWHFWCKCVLAGARFLNLPKAYYIGYRIHGVTSLSQQKGLVRSTAEQGGIIRDSLKGRSFSYLSARDSERDPHKLQSRLAMSIQASNPVPAGAMNVLLMDSARSIASKVAAGFIQSAAVEGQNCALMFNDVSGEMDDLPTVSVTRQVREVFYLDDFLEDSSSKMAFVRYWMTSRSAKTLHLFGSGLLENEPLPIDAGEIGLQDHRADVDFETSNVLEKLKGLEPDDEWEPWSLTASGKQNERSGGCEIWILDILDADGCSLLMPGLKDVLSEGWKFFPSEGSPKGYAVLATSMSSLKLFLPASCTLRLLQHAYSGQLKIERLRCGQSKWVDLYRETPDICNINIGGDGWE